MSLADAALGYLALTVLVVAGPLVIAGLAALKDVTKGDGR